MFHFYRQFFWLIFVPFFQSHEMFEFTSHRIASVAICSIIRFALFFSKTFALFFSFLIHCDYGSCLMFFSDPHVMISAIKYLFNRSGADQNSNPSRKVINFFLRRNYSNVRIASQSKFGVSSKFETVHHYDSTYVLLLLVII